MVQSITHSVAECVVILVQCLKAVNYFFHHLTGCFLIFLYLFIFINWYNASCLMITMHWFKGRYNCIILLFHFLFVNSSILFRYSGYRTISILTKVGKPSHPEELIKININQVYVASTLSSALSSITQWVERMRIEIFLHCVFHWISNLCYYHL